MLTVALAAPREPVRLSAVTAARPSAVVPTPADEQFLAAREAARTGDRDKLARLAPALAGHPLGPWVDYWRLQAKLRANEADDAEVEAFMARQPGTYLADRLRADWLVALAARGDLARFEQEQRALVWNHDDAQLRCHQMRARYLRNEGRRIDALAAEARRVLALSRDGAGDGCTALADLLAADGRLVLADRVRMLVDQNQLGAALRVAGNGTAELRPAIEKASAWLHAESVRPQGLDGAPRAAVMVAIARLARDEPDTAARFAAQIDPSLTIEQRASVWGRIGHMAAVKLLPQAAEWYRRGGERVGTADTTARVDEVLEWQVRAALRNGPGAKAPDWAMVRSTVERMSDEQQREPAWIYWRARAMLALTGGAPTAAELARSAKSAPAVADPIGQIALSVGATPAAAAAGAAAGTPLPAALPAQAAPAAAAAPALPPASAASAASAAAAAAGAASAASAATAAPTAAAPAAPAAPPPSPIMVARQSALEALRVLSGRLDFYGLLAAEDLGERQVMPTPPPLPAAAEIAQHAGNAGFARARALLALNLRPEGAREWSWELRRANEGRGMTDRQLLAVAEYARSVDLPDRMISTSERTRQDIDVRQRFPMPHRDKVLSHAGGQGLAPDLVYGLIRQESRFIAEARSSSGALGLMQLMPTTARFVARKIGITDFAPARVTDVDVNLRLGTAYLKMVLDDLDGMPALAAAAYNAGPGRPRAWRASLQRPVEGAVFAETIPFNETRDYVKRVLANAVHYGALADGRTPSLRALLGTVAPKAAGSTELP